MEGADGARIAQLAERIAGGEVIRSPRVDASPPGSPVVGVSNNTQFLRPHREGRVDAVATPFDLGARQQLWEVVLTRATDGKQLARGSVRGLQQLEPAAATGTTAG
jgi:acyl-coenzyme A thioesterase PaaI-like protein